jgi:hypothetical protein
MTLIVRPGFQFDTDASTYIEAVEVADTQALETATRYAINDFVIGCKQDGIWSAIKASCILAGARTLTGALIPLVGTAPTNVGPFVSGDYNRKTGLVGDATTKYLNSNRNNNADPQNSQHLSAYVTEQPDPTGSVNRAYLGTNWALPGSSVIGRSGTTARAMYAEMRYGTEFVGGTASATTGFFGASIGSSSTFSVRYSGTAVSQLSTSATPRNENINVFRNGGGSVYTANRLAFYSIGESLNLALLDARITALITAFGVAIP